MVIRCLPWFPTPSPPPESCSLSEMLLYSALLYLLYSVPCSASCTPLRHQKINIHISTFVAVRERFYYEVTHHGIHTRLTKDLHPLASMIASHSPTPIAILSSIINHKPFTARFTFFSEPFSDMDQGHPSQRFKHCSPAKLHPPRQSILPLAHAPQTRVPPYCPPRPTNPLY